MKLKYLSLLVSVTGITLLYSLSLLAQPPLVELQDLSNYDGKQVIANGIVTQDYHTSYGSHIITIKNDNASATIFLEEPVTVQYGDHIQVRGTVEQYKGEWELMVDSAQALSILDRWQNISIPLWQLAKHPTTYEDTHVTVDGYIDTIYDSYLYLTDKNGNHSILVTFPSHQYNASLAGSHVSVAARFFFDQKDMRYVLSLSTDQEHGITLIDR